MKTKEWLKSRLEDGDILSAEVLGEVLESYWHKSETGQVSEGDERPVEGGEVAEAIGQLRDELKKEMGMMMEAYMKEHLPELLHDYITEDTLARVLVECDNNLRAWVNGQLRDYAKGEDVDERLRVRTDDIYEEVGRRLTPYTLKDELPELVGLSNYALKTELPALLEVSKYALKTELPDMTTLVQKSEYTAAITNLNTAIVAKATAADVATAKSEAIAEANKNTNNVCALRTDFGDDGIYLKNVILP